MAALVLGLAGAAIGGSTAVTGALGISATMGASIGWSIGSMLGGMIGPKQRIEGPRLQDGKVQASTHGQNIPIIFGSFRTAGNILDFSGMREHAKEESSKKAKSVVTTYSYDCDVAVGICAGEIGGVRRIWANNELIYSVAEDADLATIQASNQAAGNIKIYTGSETQLPDPTLEALHGAGNVPAYRGLAYIVISRIWVEKYGNRLPNFEFEVVGGEQFIGSIDSVDTQKPPEKSIVNILGENNPPDSYIVYNRVKAFRSIRDVANMWVLAKNYDNSDPFNQQGFDKFYRVTQSDSVFMGFPQRVEIPYIDPQPKIVFRSVGNKATACSIHSTWDRTDYWEEFSGRPSYFRHITTDSGYTLALLQHDGVGVYQTTYMKCSDDSVNSVGPKNTIPSSSLRSSQTQIAVVTPKNIAVWYSLATGADEHMPEQDPVLVTGIKVNSYPLYVGSRWVVFGVSKQRSPTVTTYHIFASKVFSNDDSEAFSFVEFKEIYETSDGMWFSQLKSSGQAAWAAEYGDVLYWGGQSYGLNWMKLEDTASYPRVGFSIIGTGSLQVKNLYSNDDGTLSSFSGAKLVTFAVDGHLVSNEFITPTLGSLQGLVDGIPYHWNAPAGGFNEEWGSASYGTLRLFVDKLPRTDATLRSILTTISAQVGVTPDVSGIPADLRVGGYSISRQVSARGAIEPLQNAYFFDAVESDNGLKFVMRGADPVATIVDDDMMAGIDQPASGDPCTIVRGQEVELPQSVSVGYADWDSDYQTSSELVQRQATPSVNKVSTELPIAMSATHAARIADVWMYQAWSERTQLSFKVGPKHMLLEPTDVITVQTAGQTFKARITGKTDDRGVIDIAAVVDGGRYTSNATGSSNFGSQTNIGISSPSLVFLLDSPIVTDAENDAGMYAAIMPEAVLTPSVTWGGATLLTNEGGTSDVNRTVAGVGNPPACVGVVQVAVAAYPGRANIVDQSYAITVKTNGTQMDSISREQLFNGGNLFAVVNSQAGVVQELLQFQTATETDDDTYTLTGILRGRFGTDTQMTVIAQGAYLVQLNPRRAILRVPGTAAQINQTFAYKAVTNGSVIEDARTLTYANTARGLKPYAPVRLNGRRVGNDWHLRWTRRSRIDGGWRNSVDVPLGEASEEYNLTIPGKRDAIVNAPSFVYTEAMQIADFGSAQSSLTFTVAQVSAAVGAGVLASWSSS